MDTGLQILPILSSNKKHERPREIISSGTLTGQQQACLYHPGRPVPLTDPQATMAMPSPPEEAIHIWEQPLPQEPAPRFQPETGTYQNQSTLGTNMPYRGTMTGPAVTSATMESDSLSVTWRGTDKYFDPEKGWKEVSKP